ncbi:COL8A [Mytilus edulis]|uniref:COL8A n=1 Tax=Mytilus edulis TaxID=6550 RepID=A0A8S3R386_MYTED|nr:COL8A [Mytilus edulis]
MMLKLKGSGHGGQGNTSKQKDTRAFSSYLTSAHTASANANVKFDKLWTNIMNAYQVTTGVFTAPMPGFYHFAAVLMSVSAKSLFLHLWHNDTNTGGSFTIGDGHKTGTFDVVFNLKKDVTNKHEKGKYIILPFNGTIKLYSGICIKQLFFKNGMKGDDSDIVCLILSTVDQCYNVYTTASTNSMSCFNGQICVVSSLCSSKLGGQGNTSTQKDTPAFSSYLSNGQSASAKDIVKFDKL